jgi:hypothetical protein
MQQNAILIYMWPVCSKKMPSKRPALQVQRKRARADSADDAERLQPGECEMKLESSPQTNGEATKRVRPTPPQEKVGCPSVTFVDLVDLTGDDDDFAPRQPKAPAIVAKRQETAKRLAPTPASTPPPR